MTAPARSHEANANTVTTAHHRSIGGQPVRASNVEALDGQPELLRVATAAKILGLSRATAYRYAAAGELPTLRLGESTYVVTAQLREMLTRGDEAAA